MAEQVESATGPSDGQLRVISGMPAFDEWKLPLAGQFKRHHYDLGISTLQSTMSAMKDSIRSAEKLVDGLEIQVRDMKRFASKRKGASIKRFTEQLQDRCAPDGQVLPEDELCSILSTLFPWCPADRVVALVQAADDTARWAVLGDIIEGVKDAPASTRLFVWLDALYLRSVLCTLYDDTSDSDDADDADAGDDVPAAKTKATAAKQAAPVTAKTKVKAVDSAAPASKVVTRSQSSATPATPAAAAETTAAPFSMELRERVSRDKAGQQ